MKCSRCGQTMARKKETFNKYFYECMRCHQTIKARKKQIQEAEQEEGHQKPNN